MSSVRTMHTVRPSEVSAGNALTIRAGVRTPRYHYTLCAAGDAGSPGAKQWLSTNSTGGRVPMWVSGPAGRSGLVCAGQLLSLPATAHDWIYLLMSADEPVTHEVWLHYRDAIDPEWLRVGPRVVRLPLTRPDPPTALRLPDAPDVRLHAVTVLAPAESSDDADR